MGLPERRESFKISLAV